MRKCFLLLSLYFMAQISFAQTAFEIVKKSEDLLRGETSQGSFTMTVVTPDYTRKLEMDSWWVGNEKALIVIRSPKREAGNKTLKIGTEMWQFLKNTETTIKIPPSMMLQSWNGSDFTNDDLVRESNLYEDYDLELLGEEIVENENCWKIKMTPDEGVAVVWGNLYYWVRKSDNLPAKVDFYDEKDKYIRSIQYTDYKVLGGRKTPTRHIMVNKVKEGHRTEFIVHDIKFDIVISDRIFSFRELERGN